MTTSSSNDNAAEQPDPLDQHDITSRFGYAAVGPVPKVREYRPHEDPFKGNSKYNMVARVLALNAENRMLRQMLADKDAQLNQETEARIAAEARAEAMKELAYFDKLTGLYNRRALEERLVASLNTPDDGTGRAGQGLAIGFLDLDEFKAINDTYGHAAGDLALKTAAAYLSSTLRSNDDIIIDSSYGALDEEESSTSSPDKKEEAVARQGGDEFILLLTHTDADKIALRAREIENGLNHLTITVGGAVINIGGSLGISTYNPDLSIEANMELADQAMYARKQERKALKAGIVDIELPLQTSAPRPL